MSERQVLASTGSNGTSGMRVLLRDLKTGLYFQEAAQWTAEAQQAQSFKHSAEAMDFARKQRVANAEVVLAFDEPSFSVALPLPRS